MNMHDSTQGTDDPFIKFDYIKQKIENLKNNVEEIKAPSHNGRFKILSGEADTDIEKAVWVSPKKLYKSISELANELMTVKDELLNKPGNMFAERVEIISLLREQLHILDETEAVVKKCEHDYRNNEIGPLRCATHKIKDFFSSERRNTEAVLRNVEESLSFDEYNNRLYPREGDSKK